MPFMVRMFFHQHRTIQMTRATKAKPTASKQLRHAKREAALASNARRNTIVQSAYVEEQRTGHRQDGTEFTFTVQTRRHINV
jgi:hypothetical protein